MASRDRFHEVHRSLLCTHIVTRRVVPLAVKAELTRQLLEPASLLHHDVSSL